MQTVTFENNKQVLEYAASNADQILVLFSRYVEIEMIDAKLPENVIVASSFAQTYAGARKERGFTLKGRECPHFSKWGMNRLF